MTVTEPLLEDRLERICRRGCRQVSEVIAILEQGGDVPETADLDAAARDRLLAELTSIMAVYGARCELD